MDSISYGKYISSIPLAIYLSIWNSEWMLIALHALVAFPMCFFILVMKKYTHVWWNKINLHELAEACCVWQVSKLTFFSDIQMSRITPVLLFVPDARLSWRVFFPPHFRENHCMESYSVILISFPQRCVVGMWQLKYFLCELAVLKCIWNLETKTESHRHLDTTW